MKKMLMGEVARPKGLDGTVKINVVTDDFDNLKNLKTAYIGGEKFAVEKSYVANGFLFVKLVGVESVEAAENLRAKIFEIDRENASPLSDGEFYISDLIGSEVFFENGEKQGKITDVTNYGASDVIEIKTRRGLIMLPLVDDLVVSFLESAKKLVLSEKRFKELV